MKSVYDADGQRVKGTVNGVATIYVAGVYEYQGGATTLYYEGNALRRTDYASDNGVFLILTDSVVKGDGQGLKTPGERTTPCEQG